MPALDHGFKEIAQHAGRALARIAGLECEGWSPVESTLQATTERLADRAFRTRVEGVACVAYMEFITEWDVDDLWSIHSKAGLLSERERLPTLCLLFVLQKKGFVSQNGIWQLRVGKTVTQALSFVELCLWKIKPEEWWREESYLLPLLPLCSHKGSDREVIEEAVEAIQDVSRSAAQRSDLLALLAIFGEAASPGLGVTEMIGRNLITESKLFQEVAADSFLEGQRASIVELLSERFSDQPLTELQNILSGIKDRERLSELLRTTQRVKSLDEFRKHLKPKRKKKS
jgi:hypothetical protein